MGQIANIVPFSYDSRYLLKSGDCHVNHVLHERTPSFSNVSFSLPSLLTRNRLRRQQRHGRHPAGTDKRNHFLREAGSRPAHLE